MAPRRGPEQPPFSSHVDKDGHVILQGPIDYDSGWNVRATVDVDASPEIIRIDLFRQDDPDSDAHFPGLTPVPLTASLLRSVSLTRILGVANLHLRAQGAAGNLPRAIQLGKKGTDHRLAMIAAYYVAALASGSRRPRADVAERLDLSSEQVRDALHEARRRELLTESSHGRAGGQLTDAALKVLGPDAPAGSKKNRKRA